MLRPYLDFSEWSAENETFLIFMRSNDLILKQVSQLTDNMFHCLIDIGRKRKHTGRYFAVKAMSIDIPRPIKKLPKEYRKTRMPAIVLLYDNKTDKAYYNWIKKPCKGGRLIYNERTMDQMKPLDNTSIAEIVNEVKDWYAQSKAPKKPDQPFFPLINRTPPFIHTKRSPAA